LFGEAANIFRTTGPTGFYIGIDSAMLRQLTYGSTRFGIFLTLSDYIRHKKGGKNLSTLEKAISSITAGAVAAFVGNPADLVLLRIQSDATLPPEKQRKYTSVINALRRIPAEEGIRSLWKGATPSMVRASASNLGLFTTYETCKEQFALLMPNNKSLSWILASFAAGFMCSFISIPFDNAKTKLQSQKPLPDGKLPYKNIFHAMQ